LAPNILDYWVAWIFVNVNFPQEVASFQMLHTNGNVRRT